MLKLLMNPVSSLVYNKNKSEESIIFIFNFIFTWYVLPGRNCRVQLIVLGRIPTALIFVGDFSRRSLSKALERSKYTTWVHLFSSMASHWEMWGARCLPICPWGGHTGYHRSFCAFLDVFLENLLKSFCEYWSDANWTNLSLRDPFLKVGATKTCFHLRVTSLMNSN